MVTWRKRPHFWSRITLLRGASSNFGLQMCKATKTMGVFCFSFTTHENCAPAWSIRIFCLESRSCLERLKFWLDSCCPPRARGRGFQIALSRGASRQFVGNCKVLVQYHVLVWSIFRFCQDFAPSLGTKYSIIIYFPKTCTTIPVPGSQVSGF